ncbi:MAG: hypothetical protein RLZZ324_37 [Candidatus Parcubacteria bacterium]|jgi:hypothetical protein
MAQPAVIRRSKTIVLKSGMSASKAFFAALAVANEGDRITLSQTKFLSWLPHPSGVAGDDGKTLSLNGIDTLHTFSSEEGWLVDAQSGSLILLFADALRTPEGATLRRGKYDLCRTANDVVIVEKIISLNDAATVRKAAGEKKEVVASAKHDVPEDPDALHMLIRCTAKEELPIGCADARNGWMPHPLGAVTVSGRSLVLLRFDGSKQVLHEHHEVIQEWSWEDGCFFIKSDGILWRNGVDQICRPTGAWLSNGPNVFEERKTLQGPTIVMNGAVTIAAGDIVRWKQHRHGILTEDALGVITLHVVKRAAAANE